MSLDIYVPRDERFGHLKLTDFLTYALKAIVQIIKPELESLFDSTPNEFDSFEDVLKLYGEIKVHEGTEVNIYAERLKENLQIHGEKLFKYPVPQVIKGIYFAHDSYAIYVYTMTCVS
jgi:linoleate 9S-lipoxygenase